MVFTINNRPWNLGKKHSLESRKKMSLSHLGITRPEFVRKKISDGKKGKKHPNWKGGITKENLRLRSCRELKNWKQNVFVRDKYTCKICSKKGGNLNAHHIIKFIDCKELRFEIKNGITLCEECHNKTKGKEEIYESLFKVIVCKI